MKKFTNNNWVNECKESILLAFPRIGQEYINEAEHQDGEEYWMNFDKVSDVLKDVQLTYSEVPKEILQKKLHQELDVLVEAMHLNEEALSLNTITLRVISEKVDLTEEHELLLKSTYEVEILQVEGDDWMSETRVVINEEYELTPDTMPDSKPDKKVVIEILDGGIMGEVLSK